MQAFLAGRDLILLLTLLFAAISDIRLSRVSNRLLLVGAGALFFLTMLTAPDKLLLALGAILFLSICLFPLYALHFLGGGDVKLAALLLLYAPGRRGLWMLWYTLLAAAVLSLLQIAWRKLRRKKPGEKHKNTPWRSFVLKQQGYAAEKGLGTIPMAPCFFLGSLLWILTT